MITVGMYQALCNMYRVFTFKTSTLPTKVRAHMPGGAHMRARARANVC